MQAIGSYIINKFNMTSWFILESVLHNYEQILTAKFVNGEHFAQLPPEPMKSIDNYPSKVVIDVSGSLLKKTGGLDALSGMKSMEDIGNEIKSAYNNPQINHIILNVDSPGGTVDGTPQLTDLIREVKQSKRVTTFVSGMMCSGALYIGTAADEVYASNEADIIGSIGVYMLHIDQSQKDDFEGMKYTYIKAGSHKVDGNPHEKLSESVFNNLQKMVNADYEMFVNAVSVNRNLSKEQVLKYADGQIFRASDLIGSGLIDGITSLDTILRS